MKLKEGVDDSTYRKIRELDIDGVYGNYQHSRFYPNQNWRPCIRYVNKEENLYGGRVACGLLSKRAGWMAGKEKMVAEEKCPNFALLNLLPEMD